MSYFTSISRVSDGLPLAEALDSDGLSELDAYRAQAKKIVKTLSRKSQSKLTIETGDYYFAYSIVNDVCYLTLCEKSYPKKLAFKFLEELQKEFDIQYADEITSAKRPYAFLKFDTFIQKTKKVYSDTRSQRNLNKVTEDLTEIREIMNKNITDILGRGETIDSVSKKSSELLVKSGLYKKQAKDLNTGMLLRKYAWLIIGLSIILLFLFIRFYWY